MLARIQDLVPDAAGLCRTLSAEQLSERRGIALKQLRDGRRQVGDVFRHEGSVSERRVPQVPQRLPAAEQAHLRGDRLQRTHFLVRQQRAERELSGRVEVDRIGMDAKPLGQDSEHTGDRSRRTGVLIGVRQRLPDGRGARPCLIRQNPRADEGQVGRRELLTDAADEAGTVETCWLPIAIDCSSPGRA